MIRLFILAEGANRFLLEDAEGNTQGVFDGLPELFRHVNNNFNSYSLEVDSSVVNRF